MSGDDTTPGSEHITDPREMRKRLLELALTGTMPGHRSRSISAPGYIVRSSMKMAEAMGLSGEDTYTVIAWHLLHQAMRLEKLIFDEVMTRPPRPIVIDPKLGY